MIFQHTPKGQVPEKGSIRRSDATRGEALLLISEGNDEAADIERIAKAIDRYGLERVSSVLVDWLD